MATSLKLRWRRVNAFPPRLGHLMMRSTHTVRVYLLCWLRCMRRRVGCIPGMYLAVYCGGEPLDTTTAVYRNAWCSSVKRLETVRLVGVMENMELPVFLTTRAVGHGASA